MEEQGIRDIFGETGLPYKNVMDDLEIFPKEIRYKGKSIKVYNKNFFKAVAKTLGNSETVKDALIEKFGSKQSYNEYCVRRSESNARIAGVVSFHDDPAYRFAYWPEAGSIKCYCQKHKDSKEVELIADSKTATYLKKIVRHLRYMGLASIHYIASDQKLENILNMEITQRKRFMNTKPKMVSNDPETYCRLYVPFDRRGDCPTWNTFLDQFDEAGKKAIRYWIYNLFSEYAPDDKFILYIRGDGDTGKTTLCNALAEIMGHELYHTLNADRNDMARSSAVKDKLLVSIPDNKDRRIMEDPLLFNISGKDLASVRFLYQEAEMIRHSAKIIITSNILPKFDLSFDYNKIRYMLCETKTKLKKVRGAEQKMIDEFPYFINKCHKEFSNAKEK